MKRPPMPKAVKWAAFGLAKGKCACGCNQPLPPFGTPWGIIYDHRPPLMNRTWNARKRDYAPPANDPKFIRPLLPKCDKAVTFGPGGEKRITTRGGDIGEKAHERDMGKKHVEFLTVMTKKKPGKKRIPTGTIQSRGFQGSRGFGQRRV